MAATATIIAIVTTIVTAIAIVTTTAAPLFPLTPARLCAARH